MHLLILVASFLLITAGWSSVALSQAPSARKQADRAAAAAREDALRRARVWIEPSPIEQAELGENPAGPDTFSSEDTVSCQFKLAAIGGNTPKFECDLSSGETVKVKYGRDNPEVYAEVLASRLLAALGFPADRMYVVNRVRCFGCPADPFKHLQCLNEEGGSIERCFPKVDATYPQDFDFAVIERSVEGRRIHIQREDRGWAWHELQKIAPAAGGATRAQVDAFRLLAVFLGHWDNKPKNQRLLCLDLDERGSSGSDDAGTRGDDYCRRPVAMIHDLGATFGPDKLDLENWAATPIWTNPATCEVSMRGLPYGGSSFPDMRISEEGRTVLASLLKRLSRQQIRELFEGARVSSHPNAEQRDIGKWVRAFDDKVRAIADREPCAS